MTPPNRRQFLASSAGVAALGLTGQLAFVTSAQAADLRKTGHYSYKIGDIEIISIYDGVWQNDGFDAISPGVPGDDIKAALKKANLTTDYVPIEFAYTVVKTGGKTILLDTGTGGQLAPTAGLGTNGGLAAAGITPDKVDKVLISHMHPDHIFGLMDKDNAQLFPNAEIMVGETEYKFWTDPSIIEALPERRKGLAQRIQATFPKWDNVTQFAGNSELAPGLRAEESFGHTPGHVNFHISSGDEQVLLIGDAIIVPALFLANLDWQLAFDSDKDKATATRKALVDKAIADNMMIGGYHFGFPNAGKIEKDGGSHVFVPAQV
ncbi:MBL fold metallo-hydrolase [Roseovarius rhodophyticola]|uniref:MBL fold metallo-hydrolase n=1 Tax=Roseovarius rhodophyticola TaxID=3080827 RepID=A0ABZ2TFJ2_9RHOB|nr:MBL fold metallo-hydrolase [Roseovarius sp. W115]MDV2928691.1 MBL fold metallo-hydrolase [Roseovarius sp. W115]